MVKNIVVFADCDTCGTGFRVDIDTACRPHPAWDMMDVADDAIRGSVNYQEGSGGGYFGSSSVQGDAHLCDVCTEAADDVADAENRDAFVQPFTDAFGEGAGAGVERQGEGTL